ncbi:MAG: DUF1176 domain-containing protein [Flavobacteriaceae bacterium]
MTTRLAALLLLALLAALPARAAPEKVGAWYLDCDATFYCAGATIATAGDGSRIVLRVGRASNSDAVWEISLLVNEVPFDHAAPFSVAIDSGPKQTFHPGKDYLAFGAGDPEYFLTDPGLATRLLATLERGGGAVVHLPRRDDGDSAFRLDLDGLPQVMKIIGRRQTREDTARDAGAPTGLKPNPAMDGVTPLADGGHGDGGVPARVLERHRRESHCEDPGSAALSEVPAVTGALDSRSRLYAVPCSRSGKSVRYRLYRVETGEIGGIETLYFAAWLKEFGWTGTDLLENVSFHEASGTLVSEGGRDESGICASRAVHRWKGWRFALVDYYADVACKGGPPESWARLYGGAP